MFQLSFQDKTHRNRSESEQLPTKLTVHMSNIRMLKKLHKFY